MADEGGKPVAISHIARCGIHWDPRDSYVADHAVRRLPEMHSTAHNLSPSPTTFFLVHVPRVVSGMLAPRVAPAPHIS